MEKDKIKILLLEDDATAIFLVEKTLSHLFDLKTCRTIEEFHAEFDLFRPDILLLDLLLPDGSGIDLCTELRSSKINRDLAIFIMTSATDMETVERCYQAGADDFIRKPFYPSELKSKIEIFRKIHKAKRKLVSAYENQLSITAKLYQLSRMVHRKISERGSINEIFQSADILSQLIELDYIEFIKKSGGVLKSSAEKKLNPSFKNISFSALASDEKFIKNIESGIYRFKLKTSAYDIHCCCAALAVNRRVNAYILMEKISQFSSQDIELLNLYIDFINILNDKWNFEDVLQRNSSEYKRELIKIRKIQVSMLPDFREVEGFDIDFAFLPAKEISGDFFDGFFIDERIYQIIICDVSGHGMTSAYVGNELRTHFRNASRTLRLPSEIAKSVNDTIARELKDLFYYATAIIIQIDLDSGVITYMNAGHPSALISNNRQSLKLSQTGPLIGIYEDNVYTDSIIEMAGGDTMFLYTDGITESRTLETSGNGMNNKDNFFGEERLNNIFVEYMAHHPKELIHMVIGNVYEFTDYSDQEDDITAICIRKR